LLVSEIYIYVTSSLLSAYVLTVTHEVFAQERLINKNCVEDKENTNLCPVQFFLRLAIFDSMKGK